MLGCTRPLHKEASRGFEPRSLDSESRVLTVTPRGRVIAGTLQSHIPSFCNTDSNVHCRRHTAIAPFPWPWRAPPRQARDGEPRASLCLLKGASDQRSESMVNGEQTCRPIPAIHAEQRPTRADMWCAQVRTTSNEYGSTEKHGRVQMSTDERGRARMSAD